MKRNNEDSNNAPDAATLVLEWTWKNADMRSMAIAVCRLALRCGINGEFSALDLDAHGADEHGGTGIAGSIFKQLANQRVIAPVGRWIDEEFYQRRVRNRGGNPIGVWRLRSPGLCRALVEALAPEVMPAEQQMEMAV